MPAQYQRPGQPMDPRHSSRLTVRQRFYLIEVLGGWQVPYLQASGFVFPWGGAAPLPHLAVVGLQVGAFLLKVVVLIWLLMLIRWTLPRFRYDQAMRLGWLGLFPLSILNIVLTGIVLLALGR